jgi:hypothetical protein
MNTGSSVIPFGQVQGEYYSESGEFASASGGFSRKATADYDAIRIYLSSGNFAASGYYVLRKLNKPAV